MYFYYKKYTICTTFYNIFISFQELCMSLLTPFTYSSPQEIRKDLYIPNENKSPFNTKLLLFEFHDSYEVLQNYMEII